MIFVAALSIRLLHLWQIRRGPFFSVLMGDARGYDAWARELAAGDWIGREVFYQAPLYPYFIGVVYALAGYDLAILRSVQAIAGSLSCVALGYAGARLISKPAGIAAGLLLAVYAPAIFFDALIQKSVLDVFFVCLMLAIVARIVTGPARRWTWLALGVVLGGLSLTRENALVFVAVLLLWAAAGGAGLAWSRWRTREPLLLVAGLAIVLAPVAARNYAVGGGFYLTTSQFGSNLYIGNNPRSDGSYMSLRFGRGAPEYERKDATELAEQAAGRRLTPAEVSSYWTGRTLSFIRAEPLAWLTLVARKTWLLVSATEILDTESQESHAEWSWPLRIGGRLWHFGLLLPLAVVGCWTLWSDRRLRVVHALAAAYAVSVIAFFVFARYRFPLVPFVILFAVAGTLALVRAASARTLRPLAVPLAIAVIVSIVANWPIHSDASMRAITESNLAAALQENGRVPDAIEHYQRAIVLDPAYAPAHGNLGTALRAAGRVDEARASYERALTLEPDYPTVHYNLGNLLLAQGDEEAAAAHLEKSLAAAPSSVEAHNNLGMAYAEAGKLDRAIDEFRRAVKLDPTSARAHNNLGNALATRGELPEAAMALRQAASLAPTNAKIWYDLGSVFLEGLRLDDAVESFEQALRLESNLPEAHNNLGVALAQMNREPEAIAHWQRALAIKPDYADARENLARLKAGARDR